MKLGFTAVLDREYDVFYHYISQEQNEKGDPIVSGIYIRRETLGEDPPQKMMLHLEWE